MVKVLLKRVLGKTSLKYEEMTTVLCDTEAVINARPLTYVSEDAEDLAPLTPSMFLRDMRGRSSRFGSLRQGQLEEKNKIPTEVRDDFRKRFREQYLNLLAQPRGKVIQENTKGGRCGTGRF